MNEPTCPWCGGDPRSDSPLCENCWRESNLGPQGLDPMDKRIPKMRRVPFAPKGDESFLNVRIHRRET